MQNVVDTETVSGPKKLGGAIRLFVLIDALGWEYIKDREFLTDLLPYRTALKTVLGFSSGAIPSILTGALPSVTGHWNLFYFDPEGSPFRWLKHFAFLAESIRNSRVANKLLQQIGRRILGLGPLFDCCVSPSLLHLFNWVERKNIYEPGAISGARSIFDQLSQRGISYKVYSYHHSTDSQILAQAQADIRGRAAEVYFVYLCEMDMFLHTHCAKPDAIARKLGWYDEQLRAVLATARKLDPNATMAIFSDHGMTPVTRHYDLMRDIEALALQMPDDYLVIYDSTMARFWFFSDTARQQITNCLNTMSCGRILPDEEVRNLGIFFADRRYGEVIFLLHPGWLLSRSDFNGPRWVPAGMHGYHPGDSYSDAVWLSDRQPSTPMRTITDVYSYMLDSLSNG